MSTQPNDRRIRIFPSTLVQDKFVSAVSMLVNAASINSARPRALHDVTLFCALLTLANGAHCEPVNLKWTKKKPKPEYMNLDENIKLDQVYPSQAGPYTTFNDLVPSRTKDIWDLFHGLSETDKEVFTRAVYAYYLGKDSSGKYSTQSLVSYIAALGVLAKEKQETCSGNLTCSDCGEISMKHHIVGDKRAIVLLVEELLSPPPNLLDKIRKIINNVYSKHRSAFVHAAELRHEEFHQSFGLPHAFPTVDGSARPVFTYQQEFMSFELMTRYTLLEWLGQKSNEALNKLTFDIDELKVIVEIPMGGSTALPARTVVVPYHDGKRPNESISDNT